MAHACDHDEIISPSGPFSGSHSSCSGLCGHGVDAASKTCPTATGHLGATLGRVRPSDQILDDLVRPRGDPTLSDFGLRSVLHQSNSRAYAEGAAPPRSQTTSATFVLRRLHSSWEEHLLEYFSTSRTSRIPAVSIRNLLVGSGAICQCAATWEATPQ